MLKIHFLTDIFNIMTSFNVRLNSISIKNLKNVFNGEISVSKNTSVGSDGYNCDIVGIYGQNGSGKTTVIQSLDLFKKLAMGMPFWSDMADCMSVNKESCNISFNFSMKTTASNEYKIVYEVSFSRLDEKNCRLGKEILFYSKYQEQSWSKIKPIFDCNFTNEVQVFEPKNRYESLLKSKKENAINLPVAMKLALERKTSLLFSNDFFKILQESNDSDFLEIVDTLKKYAVEKLFVIQNSHNGIISLDIMPLAIFHSEENRKVFGDIALNLREPMLTDLATFETVKSVIENMNVVVESLVQGLSIGIDPLGQQGLPNGETGIRYELVSKRYDSNFPIRYESEGIKKLLSVLSLIIAMYNDSSVLIAIDELDAGVFETLLGSLLHTIEETGKGQLIFTSHNLRPLEVLDKKNIVFTTANPDNRYIRLKNVKDRNNLRDIYIRALNLGGQDEELSTEMHEVDIRRALRKAGKYGKN